MFSTFHKEWVQCLGVLRVFTSWRQEFLLLLGAVTATDGLQDAVKQPVAYADTQLRW